MNANGLQFAEDGFARTFQHHLFSGRSRGWPGSTTVRAG